MNLYEQEISKMRSLMNFGCAEENKATNYNIGVVEYHTNGADGLTYGIVREGTKFFIKYAPKKDTEILSEDYDYIGGYMNKKQYEYNSYNKAVKDLELKLMSIKEAYNSKTPIVEAFDPYKKLDVVIEQTDVMRNELQRQRQIMKNACEILSEDSKISIHNTGTPEAPKTASNSTAQSGPYTEKAKANLDKDNVKSSSDHKKKTPFDENGEVTDADMQSDKNPKGGDKTETPHTEKAQYVPSNSVANQHPKGGKAVKMNEGKRTIKMTEEQVLSWNDNKDYLDTSTETSIGDTSPYSKKVGCNCNQPTQNSDKNTELEEEVALWAQGDNINSPAPGNGKIGDTSPFDKKIKENEDVDDNDTMNEDLSDDMASNYAGFGGENGEYNDGNLDFEQEWNSWLDNGGGDEFDMQQQHMQQQMQPDEFANEPSLDDDNPTKMPFDPTYGMNNPYESKTVKGKKNVNEDKLDVFGKTPGYRKKPMNLPPNTEVSVNGAKDWNDDSVAGEKPFGETIGSSAPYTELVKQITDAVITAITNMKMDKKKS